MGGGKGGCKEGLEPLWSHTAVSRCQDSCSLACSTQGEAPVLPSCGANERGWGGWGRSTGDEVWFRGETRQGIQDWRETPQNEIMATWRRNSPRVTGSGLSSLPERGNTGLTSGQERASRWLGWEGNAHVQSQDLRFWLQDHGQPPAPPDLGRGSRQSGRPEPGATLGIPPQRPCLTLGGGGKRGGLRAADSNAVSKL